MLEELLASTRQLFSLPAVALEVLALTERPDIDVSALKQCIERDPALTAKILRVVNSSLFGLSEPVGDLSQAVARLGIKPLKLLVLGFSLPDALFANVAAPVLSRYWRTTLTRALAARELALRARLSSGEEAFLAGLLADLGLLALIQGLGEPYVRLVERAWSTHEPLPPLERRALGFDHAQFTVRMLEDSRIPPALLEAIAAQDPFSQEELNPQELGNPREPLTRVLREAERLTEQLTPDTACPHRAHAQIEPLLNPADEAELLHDLDVKVVQLAELMEIPLPQSDERERLLTEAHHRLALEATGAAIALAGRSTSTSTEPSMTQPASGAQGLSGPNEGSESEASLADAMQPGEPQVDDEVRNLSEAARYFSRSKLAQARAAGGRLPAPPARSILPNVDRAPHLDSHWTPELREALSSALSACRQSRWSLSLMLVSLERRSTTGSSVPVQGLVAELADARCRTLDHAGKLVLRLSEERWGLLFPMCERHLVVELGYELLRELLSIVVPTQGALIASVGTATVPMPSRNFVAERLYEAAERCRFASHAAGGGGVKSIEIF